MSPLPLQPDTFHWDETENIFPRKVSIFGNFPVYLKLESMQYFQTRFLEPAEAFIATLDPQTKKKLIYTIEMAEQSNDPRLFKKLHDDIWEIRIRYWTKQLRLLAFWDKTDDKQTLVYATHGFIKKTDKIPGNEIERAKRIRKKYFESK